MLLSNHNFVAFHCIMDINYCHITDSRTPILGRVFSCAKKCFDSTFFQKCYVCISSELTNNEYNSPCLCCNTFTGKEKDSETGLYYFGARYYDPSLSDLFLSVDPMADKYPNISPYAYCAWNPVKLVDPNGEDIWEIDKKGDIKWKERSNDNILYSIDENGKRGNKVEISDQEILKQLTKTNGKCMIQRNLEGKEIDKFYAYVAMSDNKEDMAKLFVFFSENTSNCEWSIYSTKDGHYGIGSFRGKRDRSPSSGTIGLKGEIKTMIHSHLDLQPNMNDEKESAFGDRCVSMGVNCNYYLYAPKTKRLWQMKKGKTICVGIQSDGYKSLLKYL